jgi:hypothetical protein
MYDFIQTALTATIEAIALVALLDCLLTTSLRVTFEKSKAGELHTPRQRKKLSQK